jgi:hypothetical protein
MQGLYSLFIEHEGGSFATQLTAASAHEAVARFFAHFMARSVSPHLTESDIIYVTPMEGLVNLWAASAGRDGHYVSITCALTADGQASATPSRKGGADDV